VGQRRRGPVRGRECETVALRQIVRNREREITVRSDEEKRKNMDIEAFWERRNRPGVPTRLLLAAVRKNRKSERESPKNLRTRLGAAIGPSRPLRKKEKIPPPRGAAPPFTTSKLLNRMAPASWFQRESA